MTLGLAIQLAAHRTDVTGIPHFVYRLGAEFFVGRTKTSLGIDSDGSAERLALSFSSGPDDRAPIDSEAFYSVALRYDSE